MSDNPATKAAGVVNEARALCLHVGYGSHYGADARDKLHLALDALAEAVERDE